MKKLPIIAAALTVLLALSVVGCGQPSSEHTGGTTGEETFDYPEEFVTQIGYANAIFDGVYAGISRGASSAVLASSARVTEELPTISVIKEIADKHAVKEEKNQSYANLERSYVGDIFTYSQLQYAIMDEYGAGALVGGFNASYDWSEANSSQWSDNADIAAVVGFQRSVAPDTASFPGAVEGRTYVTQTHRSTSRVTAYLEYYCDENTGESGVTTINYHENGRYEYHYCDAATHFIIAAFGTYDEEGVTLSSFNVNAPYTIVSYEFSEEDRTILFNYVESERVRIESRIAVLKTNNAAVAERENIETPEDMRNVVVRPDISALASLLGQ